MKIKSTENEITNHEALILGRSWDSKIQIILVKWKSFKFKANYFCNCQLFLLHNAYGQHLLTQPGGQSKLLNSIKCGK